MTGTLYLIPIPSAHADDITLRALRLLGQVSAIAVAPSDRHPIAARLSGYGITTPLVSLDQALACISVGDVAIARLGDTPGVSDAAAAVVMAAIAAAVPVVPLPGVNTTITGMTASGFALTAALVIAFDIAAPHTATSAVQTARDLLAISGRAGDLAVWWASLTDVKRESCLLLADGRVLRGGWSLDADDPFISHPAALVCDALPPPTLTRWDELQVRTALRARLTKGEPLKAAAKAIALESGWDRKAVYVLGIDPDNR